MASNCCQGIYCNKCASKVKKDSNKCSNCRELPFLYRECKPLTKIVSQLPIECEHCLEKIAKSDLVLHLRKCEKMLATCKICKSKCDRNQMIIHLKETHSDQILYNLVEEYILQS